MMGGRLPLPGPSSEANFGESCWELPPLILHPFAGRDGVERLLQTSRAALMLSGALPQGGASREELLDYIQHGRFAELRMLFYIGKDIFRWVQQCAEFASDEPELAARRIDERSFAILLLHGTPDPVRQKLLAWGVSDYPVIFSRGVGLRSVFACAPELENLAPDFVRNHHHFSDRLFECWLAARPYLRIAAANFRFQLYASGEYSRILESEWGT